MSQRDKKGRFLEGNTQQKTELSELKKLKGAELIRLFDKYGSMTLTQLMSFDLKDPKNQSRITGKDAAMIQYWAKLIQQGDVNRMKLAFNIYGIPTELKAIALKEMQDMDKSLSGNESEEKLNLTKKEKLEMLEKYKSMIESGEDE